MSRALTVICFLALASAAGAQPGFVVGRVLDDRGAPVANARVIHLDTVQTSVPTTTDGRYRIGVARGEQRFRVIALGFIPAGGVAIVRDGHEVTLNFRMTRTVVTLDSVRVAARRVRPGLQEFESRRAQPISFGRFITAADIERWTPTYASDMIRNIPGFQIVSDGPQARVLDTRSGAYPDLEPDPPGISRAGRRAPKSVRERDIGYRSCVKVYLDGASLADGAINTLPPAMLHGIEIYRGPSAPVEYVRRGTCAVILLWSK